MAANDDAPLRDVKVEGLRELRRELKVIGPEWPKALRKANKATAELVVSGAKQEAQALSSPRVGQDVVKNIKARATQSGASVLLDGRRAPHIFGHEFGSKRFKQFPIWRGNGKEAGHFLYPTIRAKTPEIEAFYLEAIDELTQRAFPR